MRLSCQTLPGLQGLTLDGLTLPGGGVSSLGLLIFNILKIYLFMTVLSFHCCSLFSSCDEQGVAVWLLYMS